MRYEIALTAAVLALASPAPLLASSSDWFETQGGRVRLVTTGKPDAEGRLGGILEVDLQPGWKTYWRDPGDAGVPPSIDIAASPNIASVEISFPPPQRHDDGFSKWAGYDRPVAFPVTFTLTSPDVPTIIDVEIFLGVCETICIPVKTRLDVDPASDPDNPGDAAAVAVALAALPRPERPDFGVEVVGGDDEKLVLEAIFPGDPASAEFFIAGEQGYAFGAPERAEQDGKTLFTVDVLGSPVNAPTTGGLRYTLVTNAGSVSGLIPYL
ncbi:MAG: hypothetical protein H0T56_10455 [Pseudaminobacter sp.]|nr:hypothetical protein [Pseudaminobacter sp.]